MDIIYFEDVEVGKKRTKSVTYQVNKEEIIEFARRQFLEDSLLVQLISFPFFRGLPHMVKAVPRR